MDTSFIRDEIKWRAFCDEAHSLLAMAANIDAAILGGGNVGVLIPQQNPEETLAAMERMANDFEELANYLRFNAKLATKDD